LCNTRTSCKKHPRKYSSKQKFAWVSSWGWLFFDLQRDGRMATSVIPKSEIRRNDNIQVGYGEVPAVEVEGILGWGLPGGLVTFSEAEARQFAAQLDTEIRQRLRNPRQLLTTLV
jgi:hypothetical protein